MLKKVILPTSNSASQGTDVAQGIDPGTVQEIEIYTSPPPAYSPIRTEGMPQYRRCGVITQDYVDNG